MSDSVSFDPNCIVRTLGTGVYVMAEMFCLGSGQTVKDFPLEAPVTVSGYAGTLSFQGLNWSWWRKLWKPNTAVCGWIGTVDGPLLDFDIQGNGMPQELSVSSSFAPITIDRLRFTIYPDLTLPTDFRAALVFHRVS